MREPFEEASRGHDAPGRDVIRTKPAEACILCGAPGEPLFDGLRDRLFGAPGHWSLRRCGACGLVWLDPRPLPEDLGLLYGAYHTHERPGPASWLQRLVRREIPAARLGYAERGASRAGRLLARVGPLHEAAVRSVMGLSGERRGRLLDVGCGAGVFLATMQALGWEVSGVETDPAAAAVAREALGEDRVRVGELAELALPEAGFDAVTLSHVIEHLPDPLATLRECRRLLRPRGRLGLATPNAASRGRRVFGRDWRGWEPPRHLQVFDPGSLGRLCASAGFLVSRLSTSSAAAYPLWLASAALAGKGSPPFAPVRAAFFWLREYAAVRRGEPVGEEVLLVAEKSD